MPDEPTLGSPHHRQLVPNASPKTSAGGWPKDQRTDENLPNSWGNPRAPQAGFILPEYELILPQNSFPDLPEAILEKHCMKRPAVIKNEAGLYELKWKVRSQRSFQRNGPVWTVEGAREGGEGREGGTSLL